MTARTLSLGILALLVSASGWAAKPADSTAEDVAHTEQIIQRVYADVLGRAPDASGLKNYSESMLVQGKDEAWLAATLRNSPEGRKYRLRQVQRHRFRRTAILVVVGLGLVGLAARKWLQAGFRRVWDRTPDARKQYLRTPFSVSPLLALFLLLYFYVFFKAPPPEGWGLAGIVALVVMSALKCPRWVVYGLVFAAMVFMILWYTTVDSIRPHDRNSDRNEAVELAAKAVLRGDNPWGQRTQLGLPITTGPSSILLALPFVVATDRINALTGTAWILFFAILLYADCKERNATFPVLCLLLLFPWIGFTYSLHWSLDELYYPAICTPFLWLALQKERLATAGALGAFMVLGRLSYVPAVAGAGLWWWLSRARTWSALGRIAFGGMLCVAGVMLAAWAVCGSGFWEQNFWQTAQMPAVPSQANWIASQSGRLIAWMPGGTAGNGLLAVGLTALAAWFMRKLPHPFFHMSLALVLAHTLSFSPAIPMDYQLTFLIPAFYAVAFTDGIQIGREAHEDLMAQDRTGC